MLRLCRSRRQVADSGARCGQASGRRGRDVVACDARAAEVHEEKSCVAVGYSSAGAARQRDAAAGGAVRRQRRGARCYRMNVGGGGGKRIMLNGTRQNWWLNQVGTVCSTHGVKRNSQPPHHPSTVQVGMFGLRMGLQAGVRLQALGNRPSIQWNGTEIRTGQAAASVQSNAPPHSENVNTGGTHGAQGGGVATTGVEGSRHCQRAYGRLVVVSPYHSVG